MKGQRLLLPGLACRLCGELQGASNQTDVGCCVKQQDTQKHCLSHASFI